MDRFVARLDDDQSSSSKTTRRKRQYVDNVGSSIYPSSSLPLPIFPSLLGEKLIILGGSFPPLDLLLNQYSSLQVRAVSSAHSTEL